jgi:hypothetical protein
MSMSQPARRVAVALLLGALLAGCGASTDDPPPTETASATSNPPVEDGAATSRPEPTEQATAAPGAVTADSGAFRVTLPPEWVDVRSQVEQEVEVAVRAEEMSDDFYTNVVVAREEPISDLEASLERAAEDIAGEEGGYELLEPVQVAGEPAPGYTFTRTTSGVEIVQTQRWLSHGDHLYVVTLSVASSQTEAGEEVLRALFGSWEWLD